MAAGARRVDLPPGYEVGSGGCELISPDDAPPELARFLIRNRTATCEYDYRRLFVVPGIEPSPPLVRASTLALRDETAAP